MHSERYVHALGAITGNQAIQQVAAGLKSVYVSGWQVAADANMAGQMYPDQSLYPANSVPTLVRRINQALQRPTRFPCSKPRLTGSIGSCRYSPTRKPDSAVRSTPTKSCVR